MEKIVQLVNTFWRIFRLFFNLNFYKICFNFGRVTIVMSVIFANSDALRQPTQNWNFFAIFGYN